jgi:hypothetical protein
MRLTIMFEWYQQARRSTMSLVGHKRHSGPSCFASGHTPIVDITKAATSPVIHARASSFVMVPALLLGKSAFSVKEAAMQPVTDFPAFGPIVFTN